MIDKIKEKSYVGKKCAIFTRDHASGYYPSENLYISGEIIEETEHRVRVKYLWFLKKWLIKDTISIRIEILK